MAIKTIKKENWLEADPTSATLWIADVSKGIFNQMSGENWVELFSTPKMAEKVPDHIRELFEVARGSLTYGYFFYPLATLACEQLFRVAETAVTEKCNAIKAPKNKTRSFKDKIEFLANEGFISIQELDLWKSYRQLRNKASHPERQNKLSIGMIYPLLNNIVTSVNSLF